MLSNSQDKTSRSEGPSPPLLSLWSFLAVSLFASWGIWLWPSNKQGTAQFELFSWHFEFPSRLLNLVAGDCVPGLLAVFFALLAGKAEFHKFLSTLLRWQASSRSYLLAFLLPVGVFWISFVVTLFLFPGLHALPSLRMFVKDFLLTLPFGPVWEELAWRAYALTALQSRYTPLQAASIIGPYWALWHIPLWLITLRLNRDTVIPILATGILSIVSWSIVFTFLFNYGKQSLPVVILLHATYLTVSDQLSRVIVRGHLTFAVTSALLSVALAITIAVRMARAAD